MSIKHLAAIFIAGAALAQSPVDPKPAAIAGMVVDAITGAPIRKADLTLANGQLPESMAAMMKFAGDAAKSMSISSKSIAAATDAAGRFSFDNVPPGTYWLTVKKAGFSDGHYPSRGADSAGSMVLKSGEEMKDIRIRLAPFGTVTGRVLDEDGDPMPSASVSALGYTYAQGRRRLMPADIAQTNNRGEFTLSKMAAGHYLICADVQRTDFTTIPAPPPADGSPEMGYATTCMPNTTDIGLAEKVDVAAGGEVTGLAIRMQKSVVVRVTGRVVDETGKPVKKAQLMMMPGNGRFASMSMAMVDDPEGKFQFAHVQPGNYTITVVQMQGTTPGIVMEPLTVPAKGVESARVGAHVETSIAGKVIVSGATKASLSGFTVMLMPAEGLAMMPVTASAGENGAFTLSHVAPTMYDLLVPMTPKGTYLKSMDFNGRQPPANRVDGTVAGATLNVVLGTDGGSFDAQVADDKGQAVHATVVLIPSDATRRFPEAVRKAETDAAGHATLTDIPPGDYLAFAWQEVEDDAWYDPDFIKRPENRSARVSIGPGAKEQAELKASGPAAAVPKH